MFHLCHGPDLVTFGGGGALVNVSGLIAAHHSPWLACMHAAVLILIQFEKVICASDCCYKKSIANM